MANGVKTRHKDYTRFAPKWQRVRDVVAGQDEVHAKGPAYLPVLVDEPPLEYDKRVRRTPFYNASWRTMAAFVGMLFRKPANLEVPEQLKKLLDDVTMSGVSFNNFAQDVTLEDIEISRVGVLVDYPQYVGNADGTALTLAQAEAMGLRPSMVMYKAESITNWHYEFINNHNVLTQVRLVETATIKKTEFEFEEETRIRVLDLIDGQYRVRLFKEDNEEQIGWDIYPLMNGKRLNYIPFWFIGPDGSEPNVSEPVLIDLVDLNLKHYVVSADYEHGCHITGLPTPVITGVPPQFDNKGNVQPQSFYIGSSAAWVLPVGADAKFLEFTGQGLSALEKNLDRKEAQMAAIGARMLTPDKAGVEAAETVAMRHSGENSILAAIAVAVSEGLTKALRCFAEWAGIKSNAEIKFEINRDFMPFPLSPQALTALLGAVQAGKLSHEAFFDLLKRGDLVDNDLKFEDEQARIDAAPPIPQPIAGAPGGEDDNEDENGTGEPKPKPGEE